MQRQWNKMEKNLRPYLENMNIKERNLGREPVKDFKKGR